MCLHVPRVLTAKSGQVQRFSPTPPPRIDARYVRPLCGLLTLKSEKISDCPTLTRRNFCCRPNSRRRATCQSSSDMPAGLRVRVILTALRDDLPERDEAALAGMVPRPPFRGNEKTEAGGPNDVGAPENRIMARRHVLTPRLPRLITPVLEPELTRFGGPTLPRDAFLCHKLQAPASSQMVARRGAARRGAASLWRIADDP